MLILLKWLFFLKTIVDEGTASFVINNARSTRFTETTNHGVLRVTATAA